MAIQPDNVQPPSIFTGERKHSDGALADAASVPVKITDVHIKFFSLMWLMVKAALAAIPAAIILAIIWAFLGGLIGLIGQFMTSLVHGTPTSL
jgi:hypothetical protein